MGGLIKYRDVITNYNLILATTPRDTPNIKFQFGFESTEDLELLLSMEDNETVSVDNEQMQISRFRQEVLGHVHKIYPTIYELAAAFTKEQIVNDQMLNRKHLKKIAKAIFSDPRIRGTICYKGSIVGSYHFIPVPSTKSPKYELIFAKLKDLELLLSIKNGQIDIGTHSLDISKLRENIIGQTHRMYIAPNKIPSQIEYDHILDVEYAKITKIYRTLSQMFGTPLKQMGK